MVQQLDHNGNYTDNKVVHYNQCTVTVIDKQLNEKPIKVKKVKQVKEKREHNHKIQKILVVFLLFFVNLLNFIDRYYLIDLLLFKYLKLTFLR